MPTFALFCDSPTLNEAVQRRTPAATPQPAAHLPPTPTEPFLHAAHTGSCWTVRGPAPAVALVGAAITAAGLHPRIDTSCTGATKPEMTVTAPDDPPAVLVDAIDSWWQAHDDRTVLLATPRSSCAGVDRAVQIVQLALQRFGPPIYVRKQIVAVSGPAVVPGS